MSTKTKQLRYRVYDKNANYQQSYSNQLSKGFDWARDCAKRVGGYVVEIDLDKESTEPNIIFDIRGK